MIHFLFCSLQRTATLLGIENIENDWKNVTNNKKYKIKISQNIKKKISIYYFSYSAFYTKKVAKHCTEQN